MISSERVLEKISELIYNYRNNGFTEMISLSSPKVCIV
jgi:hypothetical protein